jgi:hypothetical protein
MGANESHDHDSECLPTQLSLSLSGLKSESLALPDQEPRNRSSSAQMQDTDSLDDGLDEFNVINEDHTCGLIKLQPHKSDLAVEIDLSSDQDVVVNQPNLSFGRSSSCIRHSLLNKLRK